MEKMRKVVMLFGASGTIGKAASHALVAAGHDVYAVVRPGARTSGIHPDVQLVFDHITELGPAPYKGVDVVVSCIASRTGNPRSAWSVDHDLQATILKTAQAAGVAQFVLLSAICVQKPLLEFQKAKLAFEAKLQGSGMTYSIVRPTAFFKSLSGQVARVQAGKPFLLFGDGTGTACKPISDRDLGHYIARCVVDAALHNRVLPIGGPGPAITPREQGHMVFDATGMTPKFKSVPVWVMDRIIGVLSVGGRVIPALRNKAEFAKIGRYYATESMLVWDGAGYDAEATPSFGTDTLSDHYRAMVEGRAAADLGDHAVF